MALVTEDQVELQSIEWFKDLGYQYVYGYDIAVDGETPERTDYRSREKNRPATMKKKF